MQYEYLFTLNIGIKSKAKQTLFYPQLSTARPGFSSDTVGRHSKGPFYCRTYRRSRVCSAFAAFDR